MMTSPYRVGIAAMVSLASELSNVTLMPRCAASDIFNQLISFGATCVSFGGDLCDIDDRLVRQADFAQICVDHSIPNAAFARGRIVSGVKTDFATGPNKALYAAQPRECTR